MSPKDAHRNFVNCMIDAQIIDEDADVVFTKHPSGMNVEEMVAQTVRDPRSRHSILPNTLSPATTKEKYKEVVVQATTKVAERSVETIMKIPVDVVKIL